MAIAENAGIQLDADTAAPTRLVHLRNDAIHRGSTPPYMDTFHALGAVDDLLRRHGSWKRSDSDRNFRDDWRAAP